ncbi:MAG: hypothetical protein A2868_01130 [Candidatus Levybacteria bacterium RIFCSPHIGHO2_01_FULL_40_15b]|nr:MAG: hypothetical protein A2868_01130 [Candidatus Levybacteria bacterium RIFCSPHIGHO2_01_FULL_40_15b]
MVKWLNSYIARSSFASLVLFLFLLLGSIVFAETPTPGPSPTSTPTPTPESTSSSSNICTSVQECADQKLDCSKCIEYLASKKSEASGKAKTLSSEIAVTNSQIKLTEARIRATEQKIKELQKDIGIAKGKIKGLESVIDRATRLLIERIAAVYQVGRLEPWQIFLTARNIDDVFSRLKYLRIVQIYDKIQVYAAEQAKTDYQNQKEIFEDKEGEAEALSKKLDDYNNQLGQEKTSKNVLLTATRNDESRYQRLIAQAQAEVAIAFGGGTETFIRDVSQGESIGTVISGASGCSTGTHLHFETHKGSSIEDPNNYLSSKSVTYKPNEAEAGSINPRGPYPWPLVDPIFITQGYGSTPYAQSGAYNGNPHFGIDMYSGSPSSVKAIQSGKLYGGTYANCRLGPLLYAKVKHSDGLESLYLHIIPN